jgi:hypothetical protein
VTPDEKVRLKNHTCRMWLFRGLTSHGPDNQNHIMMQAGALRAASWTMVTQTNKHRPAIVRKAVVHSQSSRPIQPTVPEPCDR